MSPASCLVCHTHAWLTYCRAKHVSCCDVTRRRKKRDIVPEEAIFFFFLAASICFCLVPLARMLLLRCVTASWPGVTRLFPARGQPRRNLGVSFAHWTNWTWRQHCPTTLFLWFWEDNHILMVMKPSQCLDDESIITAKFDRHAFNAPRSYMPQTRRIYYVLLQYRGCWAIFPRGPKGNERESLCGSKTWIRQQHHIMQ